MSGPQLNWVPISTVTESPLNARTHSEKQIGLIAESIRAFGFLVPMLIDEKGTLIAGAGRLRAARQLGFDEVPVIVAEGLSDAKKRALMLADNKLAERSGWDRERLAIELKELLVELPSVGLSLDLTGFEPEEVDSLILDLDSDVVNPADEVPSVDRTAVVSKRGDCFILGGHRLLVGDAREEMSFSQLMVGEQATMAFLDVPYNVCVQGHVGGRGRIKHREFECASGEMSSSQFEAFLRNVLGLCARHSVAGSIHFVCMDWRHNKELLAGAEKVYSELKNICIWVKSNAGQGTFYRNAYEQIFVYKVGTVKHLNNFGLGQNGRSRSNVWRYPGVNSFRAGRMDELQMHPTIKPLQLVADAMLDCSRRGSIVLDAFLGSGTTLMAAEKVGRRAFCMEIDPAYVDVAVRRWQRFTGRDAIHETSGKPFDALAASRGSGGQ